LVALLAGFTLLQAPALAETDQASSPWSDVAQNHWAAGALQELVERYKLQLGFPDGQFKGQSPLSRYEMAALLAKVLKTIESKQLELKTADLALIEELKALLLETSEAQNERLEMLEDRSDLLRSDLEEGLDKLEAALGIRPFGSLAVRYCGMTTRLGDPAQILGANFLGSTFQVRLGAGVQGKVPGGFDWQVRLLTNDNNSYNLSWYPFGGNHIPRAPITLDRFFIRYQPQDLNASNFQWALTAGKAPNLFAETELVFDEDISFSGLSQSLKWKNLAPFWKSLSLEGGEYALLVEETFITTALLGAKLSSEFQPAEAVHLKVGGSYLHYLGADQLAKYNFAQGYQGIFSSRNRGADKNNFESDFHLLNGFAKLELNFWENLPISLNAEYLRNLGSVDKNQGWWAGLQLGELKDPGSWQFKYAYRGLEQEANLSLMVEDTLAGTNVSGHMLDLGVRLAEKTSLNLTLHMRTPLNQPESDHLYILYTTLRQDF